MSDLARLLAPLAVALAGCGSASAAPPGAGVPWPGDAGAAPDAVADAGSPDAADASLDDPPIDPRYAAFAAAFEQERQELGAPGAAVAFLEHGQLTFFHGFGTKGPSSTEAVRARTLFRIGSMTKALTAMATMHLVEGGKIDLDAKLTSVVPDVAISAPELASLTMRDLLSHQSGLVDYLVLDSSHDDAALSTFLTSSAFRSAAYFMDPPGTFWNYANTNFYLDGLALERAGGMPYRQAMSQTVFAPLGMTRTFFLPSEALADGDVSDGLSTDQAGKPADIHPDSYDNAWGRPCGFAFSSVLDYARFVQFLWAGSAAVLADAQRQEMETRQVDVLILPESSYGLGLFVNQGFFLGKAFYPTPLVSHGGDISGYASDFYLVPSSGFGIVMFANADGAHFTKSLVMALQSFAGLPAPSPNPPSLALDPATLPAIAGTYYDPYVVGHVTVTVQGSTLGVSMPDLDAANVPYDKTLTFELPNNFMLSLQGQQEELTFIPDATGAYQWMRDRAFVAKRQPASGSLPSPRAPQALQGPRPQREVAPFERLARAR